jgi:hypothetical protein
MGTAASPMAQGPPLPPDIVRQQQAPEESKSVFAMQGVGQPQPGMDVVQQIGAKVQELDAWAGEMKNLVGQYDPSLMPFLEQIGKAAMGLASAVQSKAQRSGTAKGSPVVPPQPPQNPATGPMPPQGM